MSSRVIVRPRYDLDWDLYEVAMPSAQVQDLSLQPGHELVVGDFRFRIIEEVVPESALFCRLLAWLD